MQLLAFLQGTGSLKEAAASSSSGSRGIASLRNQLTNKDQQIQSLKRKLGEDKHRQRTHRRGAKGGNEGRGHAPAHWNGLPTTTPAPEGKRMCFDFNNRGCTLARPGDECYKGKHVCPKCYRPHSIWDCQA